MANILYQPVVSDLGSKEFAQLANSYNELLDVLGDLITGLKTAADTAAINTLATTAEAALVANVVKLKQQPNIPITPSMATSAT